MITSINWEQAEVEMNREHYSHSTIYFLETENKDAFIKTDISEKRDERKVDDHKSALKPMRENTAQFQGRLCALRVERAYPGSIWKTNSSCFWKNIL